MPLECKNCKDRGISLLHAVVYSLTDPIRCQRCGREIAVPSGTRLVFGILEGLVLLVAVIASVAVSSIWPLLLAILVAVCVRVFVVSAFSRVIEE